MMTFFLYYVVASTTDIPQATSNQTLKDGFPWLASALNPNGTITVAERKFTSYPINLSLFTFRGNTELYRKRQICFA